MLSAMLAPPPVDLITAQPSLETDAAAGAAAADGIGHEGAQEVWSQRTACSSTD